MICDYSLIVPCYNAEVYVQSFCDNIDKLIIEDFKVELIIVNDGSTDNTLELIRRHNFNSNIILKILNQNNVGTFLARYNGIKNANGEYICFLDIDDYYEPSFFVEINKLRNLKPDII